MKWWKDETGETGELREKPQHSPTQFATCRHIQEFRTPVGTDELSNGSYVASSGRL